MSAPQQAWVPDVDSFAVRLMLIRHRMGWNAKQAAVACGLPAQSWREWESMRRRPRDYEATCRRVAARTGCDLVWLMVGRLPVPGQSVGWPVAVTPSLAPMLRLGVAA
jgi:hypothetical protein